MKYLWTTLHVKNLDVSIKFYEEILGLKVERRFQAGPGMEIGFLVSQGTDTRIELIQEAADEQSVVPPKVSMGFLTEDVEKKKEEMQAAGYQPTEIYKPNPSTQYFFIKDPDGLSIQFVQES
ncbi:lactoylglutathione lyase [Clostridiales Family XIII bacterium PM5-7]